MMPAWNLTPEETFWVIVGAVVLFGGLFSLAFYLDKHKPPVPIKAKIIDHGKSNRSSVGRAVVGGAVAGPLGAVVGAASGIGSDDIVVFKVWWSNGKTTIEKVRFDGEHYNRYLKLIEVK